MSMSPNVNRPTTEMNVTPLIDVLLVLLITFMVISPVTPRGLQAIVPQPATDAQPPQKESAVVLQVLAGGEGTILKLNAEPVAWDRVQARLHDVFLARVEKVLFVKGDKNVNFEDVARAIDLARSAGVDRVGLVTANVKAGIPGP